MSRVPPAAFRAHASKLALSLGCAALAGFCVALGGCARFEPGRIAPSGPLAVGGVLDLRSWDFEAKGAVSLAGEWDFASGALVGASDDAVAWQTRSVPDFWNRVELGERSARGFKRGTGAGTYRLRVLLPAGAPSLAIRNYTGYNAFELECCGARIAGAGRPSLDPATAASAYLPGVSPVEPRSGELELYLRVSNWDYRGGGVWKVLSLGDRRALAIDHQRSVYVAIALAAAIAALSINSFIIFANRRKEGSYFFFGLFGLVIGLRPLVCGEYALVRILPSISFELLVRIEYATAFLAVPAAVAFFLSFFSTEHKRRWGLVLLLPFAPFVLADLFLPLYWLTWSIFPFYGVAIAAMVLAAAAVLSREAYRKTQGGLAMFVGGLAVALCGINDILYSAHAIDTGNLLPLSLALFVFLQSFVLARRLTGAFDAVEALSQELATSNGLLKKEIQEEMATSARLEESLSEKETLLKEVHHRVKNSLQIVSSIVSLQANRSSLPEVELLSRSIKERIRVISLASEKLYDIESGDNFDVTDYARDILKLALSSYGSEESLIEGRVEGERVQVESAIGIDFGLIVTELITNAIKHAVLPSGGGPILVDLREEAGYLRFAVIDEGPGFPEGFDPERATSLGFKIVVALLRRWEGSISVSGGRGARVECGLRLQSASRPLDSIA
jgi:two-component sensor histidine kinase